MKDLRQFLKGMELETEQIDTIMAEVGKNFSTLKEERDSLKDKVKELEASNSDTATKLQNLERELKSAVESEDYEKAAKLKKEIDAYKQNLDKKDNNKKGDDDHE